MAPTPYQIDVLYRRMRRRVRFGLVLPWLVVYLAELLLAAWAFDAIAEQPLESWQLTTIAWCLLLGVTCTILYGLWRTSHSRWVETLVKENLKQLYPEQRRDLDTWFASELYGPRGEAVWTLIIRRLEGTLPKKLRVRLAQVPYRGMTATILLMILVIVLVWSMGASPAQLSRRFARRLALGHNMQPLAIESLLPERRWLTRNEKLPLEVLFDKPVDGLVQAEIVAAGDSRLIPLTRVTDQRYRGLLPGQTTDFELLIHADALVSAPIAFETVPKLPVQLQHADVFGLDGRRKARLLPNDFPAKVSEGADVRFTLTVAPGPWESFGLGGSRHGEVVIQPVRSGEFEGTATILQDDQFSLFWAPPEGGLRQSAAFQIECVPDQPPTVTIDRPENGRVFQATPPTVGLRISGKDDNGIVSAWLYITDYYNLQERAQLQIKTSDFGKISATAAVRPETLGPRQGQLLGFCVAVVDNASAPNISFSAPVHIVLPQANLISENQQKVNEFWQAIASAAETPGTDPGNPLEPLLDKPETVVADNSSTQPARSEQATDSPGDMQPQANSRPHAKPADTSTKSTADKPTGKPTDDETTTANQTADKPTGKPTDDQQTAGQTEHGPSDKPRDDETTAAGGLPQVGKGEGETDGALPGKGTPDGEGQEVAGDSGQGQPDSENTGSQNGQQTANHRADSQPGNHAGDAPGTTGNPDDQAAAGNDQAAAGNDQAAAGNDQAAAGNDQAAAGNNPQPGVSKTDAGKPPGTNGDKPGDSDRQAAETGTPKEGRQPGDGRDQAAEGQPTGAEKPGQGKKQGAESNQSAGAKGEAKSTKPGTSTGAQQTAGAETKGQGKSSGKGNTGDGKQQTAGKRNTGDGKDNRGQPADNGQKTDTGKVRQTAAAGEQKGNQPGQTQPRKAANAEGGKDGNQPGTVGSGKGGKNELTKAENMAQPEADDDKTEPTTNETEQKNQYHRQRSVEVHSGRKPEAQEVGDLTADLNTAPDADEPQQHDPDREVIREEMAKATRRINPTIAAEAETAKSPWEPLPASQREKAIDAHEDTLQRLSSEDRYKLREYYRMLRDIQ